jgi:cell division protein FtsI/penicillin-binding protein 2
MPMPPPVRTLVAALLGLGLVAALPACSSNPPDKTLNQFLEGWSKADFGKVDVVSPDGQKLTPDAAKARLTALEGDLAGQPVQLKLAGKPTVKNNKTTVPVNVTWTVAGKVPWTYQTNVQALLRNDKWAVILGPATVHPDLTASDKLAVRRSLAARGAITDATGTPIVSSQPVVVIGVQPNKVQDVAALSKALGDAFKSVGASVDLTHLADQVKAAKPDAFVEVVTLRRMDYDKIRAQIHELPGTVFRESTQSLAPTKTFARALLGRVGPVTKEIMDKNPGKYQLGDTVGAGGLQQRYDDLLRGAPGVSVVIPGKTSDADKVLFHTDPQSGTPVKITLDVKTQTAAETALSTETTHRAAIVAIRVSDGAVLAVTNGPVAPDLNLALTAQVAPGSTFKTVTAVGVLDNGSATPDTVVPCPASITVDGAIFKNSKGEVLGNVPLHIDYAQSCNTAFASLAPKLGPDGLAKTAANLGIGVSWDLGIDAYSGKVSSGGSPSEQAAAAFGQGTTTVSPVALAGAAAAIARGQWKQPHLMVEPAPAKVAPDGPPLKPEVQAAMKSMMREVVTSGTGTGVKSVKGEPVYGKTGTAEFANGSTATHSWFIGFRGDLAFAVFVESGGLSTEAAVPMAGRFFTALG